MLKIDFVISNKENELMVHYQLIRTDNKMLRGKRHKMKLSNNWKFFPC